MGFFDKIISFFKKRDNGKIDTKEKSISEIVTPTQSSLDNSTSDVHDFESSTVDTYSGSKVSDIDGNLIDKPQSGNKKSPPESTDVKHVDQNQFKELSYIDVIRVAEEERKKRERLEFLRTKRAKRRKELEEELNILDKQLEYVQQRIWAIKEERKAIKRSELPGFNVHQYAPGTVSANGFPIPPILNITSMREYQAHRIEEERRRREVAENSVLNSIAAVRKAVANRNLPEAEGRLSLISPQVVFVENQDIRDKVKEIVLSITELRNQLDEERRAREEEQRKKEALDAKLRAEAQERERQEWEKSRQKEEEEKKERARIYHEELQAKEEAQRKEISRLESLSSTQKEDADDIEDFFKNNGVLYFYHITEASNIPLIKQRKGLYSWSYLESHGMKIPFPGGDTLSRGLDRDKGLEDYVKLSLCKSHPMAYRFHKHSNGQAKLVLLKIKVDVALFESTLFSDINVANKNAKIGDNLHFIENGFDFNAIRLDWCYGDTSELSQAEVMVKTFIPVKYIVNLDNPEEMTFNN